MSDPHARLDAAMRLRRLELGMRTWRDLANAAGISYETIRALRKGDAQPADGTTDSLERVLRWPSGTIESILSGGSIEIARPVPVPDDEPTNEPSAPKDEYAEVIQRLDELKAYVEELQRRRA